MLPNFNNVYGSLTTRRSKAWIAKRFKKAGWSTRECSWYGYEVECDYAELVIEGESPILMSGAVADFDTNISSIMAILATNGIGFTIDRFDESGNLLRTVVNTIDE
ncbi:MAG: hypothetical protein KDA86_17295 [Planctomycetaceae bacterium]|nr:hypothetical protein [Planctomycetaceae bacterium]